MTLYIYVGPPDTPYKQPCIHCRAAEAIKPTLYCQPCLDALGQEWLRNYELGLLHSTLPAFFEAVAMMGARPYMLNPIMLCGNMFGLRVYRHRLFESNIFLFAHSHIKHRIKAVHAGVVPKNGEFYCPIGNMGDKAGSQRAMGIDWMKTTGSKDKEIAQAIPPAYTRWIAQFLLAAIEAEEVAVS